MKKFATLMLVGASAITLSACTDSAQPEYSVNDNPYAVPYTMSRTAKKPPMEPVAQPVVETYTQTEQVFVAAQTK